MNGLIDIVFNTASEMASTKTIFKYNNLSSGLKSINESTIAMSRPDRFNDPFDCNIELLNVDANETRTHMSSAFAKMLGSNYSERFRLKNQLNKATNDQVIDLVKYGLSSDLMHRGVTCFSKNFNQPLMWAHYCDNHKGVCIGYSTIELYGYLRSIVNETTFLPVQYLETMSKKNLYPTNSDAILYWLKTKSKHWAYEEEMRITGTGFQFNNDLLAFVEIDPKLITDVYIGLKVDTKDIYRIYKVAKERNPDVKVFKMEADFQSFNLTPKELFNLPPK